MKILGIETSCDETAAAVVELQSEIKNPQSAIILSNVVSSQIDIHALTGGVVPEVASRAHVEKIISVAERALKDAKVTPSQIDAIAVTAYPGLIGSLLVGVNTAKSLALAWGKPLIPVNHLEGHIYANFVCEISNLKTQISNKSKIQNLKLDAKRSTLNANNFEFPAIILLVSGGHTSLILMKDHGQYQTLGETLDDAAGEAFDKVAKILGLPYPGGPVVSAEAEKYREKLQIADCSLPAGEAGLQIENPKSEILNHKSPIVLPRPMLDSNDFNFSFSGLKTAVLYAWQRESGGLSSGFAGGETSTEARKRMFAYEFEEAATDVLVAKTIKAAQKYKAKTISIAGGVAANKRLREKMRLEIRQLIPNTQYLIPDTIYCGDNAVMIATCAAFQLTKKTTKQLSKMNFEAASSNNL
ncbi:tRNA (adenosine(37)-N6)-threonylcarbamoyltransferase complex transferase subunit TsaD [Candidatus Microgenomates bacterium]|nr:tRNA (adenosine(37)-N6)-threonylcarbamoyltransferase complex transferase subunit TsaD [Candidatus Microgenomates bacterium]